MRIAVCLSGQPRHIDKCIDSINKYLVEPNNADVYFHFWSCHPKETHFWYHSEDVQWDVLTLDDLKKLVRPVNCLLEPQIEFDMSDFPNAHCPAYNVWSWTYSSQACHALYNPEDYDVVVHCRPDLLLNKTVVLDDVLDDTFYVEYRETPGDQFAFGKTGVMQKFSQFHANLPDLYNQIGYVHCETMLAKYMEQSGCQIVPADVTYQIWRQENA